ncbi:MAG: DUF6242 domain-containing protein [Prevotella sp.]|jgi:hypothetical protein|nr:DUF6242 domain-containing protein [Prevotella sp.]MCH4212407.1 DUF6242 domain-containing protein [Prevotella sp.]MCH4241424.1 DUF6242 domain-containing protein [Prevotella sp.]
MKKTLSIFVVMLCAVWMLSSCLSNNDDITYYHDTAITSFSVGTLNSLVDKMSDGKPDTVNCAKYKFNIDQISHIISNRDSLPAGLDAKKIVTTISSKNSGIVGVLQLDSLGHEKESSDMKNVVYYQSTDSLDLSVPRHLYVFNSNLSAYVVYTLKVNFHKEFADSFPLNHLGVNAGIAALSNLKAVVNGDEMYIFGEDGNSLKIFSTPITDGKNWTEIPSSSALQAKDYQNVVAGGGYLYFLSGGAVYRSKDARTWDKVGMNPSLTSLVGASTMQLFGTTATGFMYSGDGGSTWSDQSVDGDVENLLTANMSCVLLPSLTNDNTDLITLVGNDTQGNVSVWNHVAEYSLGAEPQGWSYTAPTVWYQKPSSAVYIKGVMPDKLLAAAYGSDIEALGSDLKLYNSNDHGLTWHLDSAVTKKLTRTIGTLHKGFAFTSDKNNNLWIIDQSTGNIWRGRHNSKGWSDTQTDFTN